MHVIYFSDPAPAAQQSPSIPGPPPTAGSGPGTGRGVRVTDPGGETRGTALALDTHPRRARIRHRVEPPT